jgi:DNA-binding GntR family transcriptional regulator
MVAGLTVIVLASLPLHFVRMKYQNESPPTSTGLRVKNPSEAVPSPTPLQLRLSRSIVDALREDASSAEGPINQQALAERLGVSRTPVRAALELLAGQGAVARGPRGFIVADLSAAGDDRPDEGESGDALLGRIARDRHAGALPQDVSEADLMRRYGASRAETVGALRRLAELGLAIRKPGFGWRFLAAAATAAEKEASYRFRLAIEPAALRQPGFAAEPGWLAAMRSRHARFLDMRWREADAVAFFEMNAEFHLGLVSFSGNPFFIQATRQQNSLRRLRNYSWSLGPDRVAVSCRDHLAIIAALEEGDAARAAELLARHLETTATAVGARTDPVAEGRDAR